jgi:hypothetical protein
VPKLRFLFALLAVQTLLISCASPSHSGSGFLIGRVDPKYFGDPIFRSVSPAGSSVAYLNRESGFAFVSAETYDATSVINPVRFGSTMLPQSKNPEDEYLYEAYRMVACKQRTDCAEISLCDGSFQIETEDVESIYSEFQIRGFPIAQFRYISDGANTYNVTISYFTDCEKMVEDIRRITEPSH